MVALRSAVEAGLSERYVAKLEEIVQGERFDIVQRTIPDVPPVSVAYMQVTLKQGADHTRVESDSLCVARVLSKKSSKGYCMVAEFPPHGQCELRLRPLLNPEIKGEKSAYSIAFKPIDSLPSRLLAVPAYGVGA